MSTSRQQRSRVLAARRWSAPSVCVIAAPRGSVPYAGRLVKRSLAMMAIACSALVAGMTAGAAHAQPRPPIAIMAAHGELISAPRESARVTRLPLRVVVRAPAGAGTILLRIDGHDVSGRLRGRGRRRVAALTLRDGLRYGRNYLWARAERSGRSPVSQTVSFVLARHALGQNRLGTTVQAPSLLVPVDAQKYSSSAGRWGIQIGDQFYPNPSPDGQEMQWLTLDRSTLQPTKTANNWFDGTSGGPHGLSTLTAALKSDGLDQLVFFENPPNVGRPPVQSGQVKGFKSALAKIGVAPPGAGFLTSSGQALVFIGVPFGNVGSSTGSGWWSPGGLSGWLMPDTTFNSEGAVRMRFVPVEPPFDTSSSSTTTSNTMTIRDQSVPASLPAGATGGFQLVQLGSYDSYVARSDVYATNGVADPAGAIAAMVARLQQIYSSATTGPDQRLIAVQTIGHVTPSNPDWGNLAQALAAFGADPDVVNTINGSYAFFGGPELARTEDAQSSSAVVIDPTTTPPETQTGTLRGRVSLGPDGFWRPTIVDARNALTYSLYDIVFRPSTPWPYTAAAGDPDWRAYAKALADITNALPALSSYAPDLRQAYVNNDNISYSDSYIKLTTLKYPGDNRTCSEDAGTQTSDPGYTRTEFCNLSDELGKEFTWLDATKDLFDAYDKVLDRAKDKQAVDLNTIGTTIKNDVAPPDDSIVSSGLALVQTIADVADTLSEETGAGLVVGALGEAYQLSSEIATAANGTPLPDQISAKADDLAAEIAGNAASTADALDRLRDVIISDHGRLQALGSVADGRDWSVDVPAVSGELTTAADRYFIQQLFPLAYQVDWLAPTSFNLTPTAQNCNYNQNDEGLNHWFKDAPASSQLQFTTGFESNMTPVQQLWILNKVRYGGGATPPQTLTDTMFSAPSQSGYGFYAPDFFWQLGQNPPPQYQYDCRY
jgi:hypothetical protein